MSTNRQRRHHSNLRGPERFRWQRKEPPHYPSLFCLLLFLFLLILCIGSNVFPSWGNLSPASSMTHYSSKQQQQQQHTVQNLRKRHNNEDFLLKFAKESTIADAIVVGSGLAGLTATLTILDRGGKVILIEKESVWGGNSNKASSGMNACCIDSEQKTNNDTIADFVQDTVKSAGAVADLELIDTLVSNSASALTWLQNRVHVDLSVLAQLGGHSRKRTHRPKVGFVGAELINAMESAIREYEDSEQIVVLVDTQVSQVLYFGREQKILGVVAYARGEESSPQHLRADHVVLATGGFASDRSPGSYLEQYRPELLGMAATAGAFSTGDGITLGESLGAATRDMEKVQIHPTGFVDPNDPTSPNKVLAAELLRGVGGILLNHSGHRFCNELGTRSYVTDKMLEHDPIYATTRKWNAESPIPTFFLVLSSTAASEAKKHVDLYMHKGLIRKVNGWKGVAECMGLSSSSQSVLASFQEYQTAAETGQDAFGKTVFHGVSKTNLEDEVFYVGEVMPVLHYCMGGLKIDRFGNILDGQGYPIRGLHAAGEVTGGVHGNNRLGGNSLLECAVYGTIVGREIPILNPIIPELSINEKEDNGNNNRNNQDKHFPVISFSELSEHTSRNDAWVAIHGGVYDVSQFAKHHPGGEQSILSLAGMDGTDIFSSVHSNNVLFRLANHQVGVLDATEVASPKRSNVSSRMITVEELKSHNTRDDCWVSLYGTVYDLTEFSKTHPGGSYIIQKLAGKDATVNYQVFHPRDKLLGMGYSIVGQLVDNDGAPSSKS